MSGKTTRKKVKELKLETLLTTVLREKLYYEKMDIKQLQDDLAVIVRGNDILKCEVQNMLDTLSYATPKLKYLELQVLKKDENINQLTNDLQERVKELGVVKAILPKVFQERDFMWEEVKSYSEMNILLNYEINMLKRKEVALEGISIHDIVHQNSTCSAAENVGTAAKPNGIVHKPRADASTNWREFTSPKGIKYYYNKVTRKSKWRMPDEVKLAREKDTILHASDFGSISVVKTSSPVEMKNSLEPASPTVANSLKIGIAVTLGNSVAPSMYIFRVICYKFASGLGCFLFGMQFFYSSETTTTQDAVVYECQERCCITEIGGATPSDEKTFKLGPLVYESKAEAKSAFKTLLESANIGSDCMWDQVYYLTIFKAISILEHDERFKAVERAKDCEDLFEDYVEELEKKEYIRDLESKEEEQGKLWMEKLRKAERKNRDEFRKLMEEHVSAVILNAKTNWRDYCIKIKDFAAYLAVSSNTS
ncbi:hypothetical protein T459_28834 [Capsicum annuum]|uniref:WW domain-containing protein n=1 Tax=Capsicum annuum TaxID=4072 RepID=A0A2G2YHY0_CAPAN|nr:hypothetical protein T459_28834 [Capsicum annuum]